LWRFHFRHRDPVHSCEKLHSIGSFVSFDEPRHTLKSGASFHLSFQKLLPFPRPRRIGVDLQGDIPAAVPIGNFLRNLMSGPTRTRFVHSERLSDVLPGGQMTEERSVIDMIGRTVLLYPDRRQLRGGDESDLTGGHNEVIRFATENPVDAFVEDGGGDSAVRMKFSLDTKVARDIDRSG